MSVVYVLVSVCRKTKKLRAQASENRASRRAEERDGHMYTEANIGDTERETERQGKGQRKGPSVCEVMR